jgi:hypothetical protein
MKTIAKALAAIFFLVLIGIEFTHSLSNTNWGGYTGPTAAAAYVMLGIWLTGIGAVSLPLKLALPWLASAVFFTLAYGLSLTVGGTLHGLIFVGASISQLALLSYGFSNDSQEDKIPKHPDEEEVDRRHAA